jgi:catechol 2,3-dioxygenase-like lactoylglutathione lyase family enzyme
MEARFHHVGYATKSITKSIEIFRQLGYEPENLTILDKLLGVKIQFLANSENTSPRIELVEDVVDGDIHPVLTILKQRPGSYHFAYLVDSIQEFSLKNKLFVITPCSPAQAFGGRHVQFFMSRDDGIIELISNALECTCANNG